MRFRTTLVTIAFVAGVALAAPVQPAPADVAVSGRWLVAVRAEVPPERVARVAQEAVGSNGRVLAVWSSALRGFLVEIPDSRAGLLAEHPLVERVVQDRRFLQPFSTPISDCSAGTALAPSALPSLPEPITCLDPDPQNASGICVDNWGLDRLDGPSVTRDGIYNPPRTGQGVHLFLLDTGLYAQHQDFAGRVGAGFDATAVTGTTDDCGSWSHGSHVAGIAAGTQFGVAKGATLHSVRVATCPVAIQLSFLVAGFDWIAQVHATTIPGPAVASMSINAATTDFSDPGSMLNTAISGTIAAGVLVIESAGNNLEDACGHISRAPGVLIVGGSDEFDTPWERAPGDPNYAGWCTGGGDCGSNTGPCVSLFAPAAHIVSSWFGSTVDPRSMCRLSGTSMAAPHAAGVAALYLQAHPTATPAQLRQGLIDQARPVLTALPAATTNKLLSVVEGQPGAGVSPLGLDFGMVGVGLPSLPLSVIVTSTGALPLRVTGVGITGGEFVLSTNGCVPPLVPAATCALSITFTPQQAGRRDASLTFSTDDPARPTVVVALQGVGVDPRLTIVLTGAGAGVVDSAPAGISCGASCAANFPAGTTLMLTASPSPGSTFAGWSDAGLCNAASCSLVLTQTLTVQANFTRAAVDAGFADAGAPDAGALDAGSVDAGIDAGGAASPDSGTADAGAITHVGGVVGGCGCNAVDFSALLLTLVLLCRRPRVSTSYGV
jgi:subtilisin family serine protease